MYINHSRWEILPTFLHHNQGADRKRVMVLELPTVHRERINVQNCSVICVALHLKSDLYVMLS